MILQRRNLALPEDKRKSSLVFGFFTVTLTAKPQ